MTGSPILGIVMFGFFIVFLVVASVVFGSLDSQGRGSLVGAGLGLLNLIVGYQMTRRTLRHGLSTAMATIASGFIGRLIVITAITLVFQRTGLANATSFALTFMLFFFVHLGVEVLMVQRSLGAARKAKAVQ